MSNDPITPKKYPHTTAEVAKMLGIHPAENNLPMGSFPIADLPVANLPVAHDDASTHSETVSHTTTVASSTHLVTSTDSHSGLKSIEEQAASQPGYVKMGKAILPYAAIFLVGIFLYYFFFTKVDFSSIFKSSPKAATPQVTEIQQLEQQDASAYNSWIASYYYDVSDSSILDPEADNSGNGLSNFQKYLLDLNPKSYDTLGLGQADSQTLAMGINPLTGKPETDAQKALVSKYIDMEVVINRLTLYSMQNPGQVAGASTASSETSNSQIYPAPGRTQTTNLNPISDSQVNIDTSKPGLLEIPDLKISVPIIWTKDPNNFETDLQVGVVHYPGTALPGQVGTTYIAGHSSNYAWAKGSYNQIFSKLGNLGDNTSFKITVTQTNGKPAVFDYIVTNSQQYSPTDQAQFANTSKSVVALSTCWPVGSTAKRLVVFGELTQVED
jgi:LPXTG-site transpeptidase (sortase) family protein